MTSSVLSRLREASGKSKSAASNSTFERYKQMKEIKDVKLGKDPHHWLGPGFGVGDDQSDHNDAIGTGPDSKKT